MTTQEKTQIVTFRLGEDLFAADIFSVERVLRYREPTPVPNAPAWLEGVTEYQSRVVPVVNLRTRFGLPPVPAVNETRMLVLNTEGTWVAAVVDSVLDVSKLDAARLAPPPPIFRGLAGEYLRGIVRRDDRLVILLDVARLLSADEQMTLLRVTEQERADA